MTAQPKPRTIAAPAVTDRERWQIAGQQARLLFEVGQ